MNWNNFQVDERRCLTVVDAKFYQVNLTAAVDEAKSQFPEETMMGLLPSWTKFAAEPMKAAGFFTIFVQAFFNSKHNLPSLDYKRQRDFVDGIRVNGERSADDVFMMFLPSNIRTNKNSKMDDVVDILKDALQGGAAVYSPGADNVKNLRGNSWLIVPVNGGNKFKGVNAQDETLKAVELGKVNKAKVLIVASCQAQRSFSIPSLCNVLLCYDAGQAGATNQKGSRAFTPDGTFDKVGRVISCSFNPNRDDKFDAFIIQAASNLQKRKNINDFTTAVKMVLDTLSFSNFGPNGSVSINKSAYLQQIMQNNRFGKVVSSKLSNVKGIKEDEEVKTEVLASHFGCAPSAAQKTDTGKTFSAGAKKKGKKGERKLSKEDEEKILEDKIASIIDNRKVIIFGANARNITEAIEVYENDKGLGLAFVQKFGMTHITLKKMLVRGYIDARFIDVMVAA